MSRSSLRDLNAELERIEDLIEEEEQRDQLDLDRLKRAQREFLAQKDGGIAARAVKVGVEDEKRPIDRGYNSGNIAPPGPSVETEGLPQPIKVLSEVVEREPNSSSHARQSLSKNHTKGFPEAAHRSKFKQARSRESLAHSPTRTLAKKGQTDFNTLKGQIDLENRERLRAMSLEEVEEERASLETQFDPKILDMLKKRALKRGSIEKLDGNSMQPRPKSDSTPKDSEDPEHLRQYFPGVKAEPSKLAWMKDVETREVSETEENTLRYDLSGRLLSPEESLSIRTTKGLHHHGDEPDRAGYTLKELLHLSRSTVFAQKKLALTVFGKVVQNLRDGKTDAALLDDVTTVLPEFVLILRIDLDSQIDMVVVTALAVLSQILGPEEVGLHDHLIEDSMLEYDKDDTVGRHLEILKIDIFAGLIRTGIVPALTRILANAQCDAQSAQLSLVLMGRLAQHHPIVAKMLWSYAPLVDRLRDKIVHSNWPDEREPLTSLSSLALIKDLVRTARDFAGKLIEQKFQVTLMRFLVNDLATGEQQEALTIVLGIYGCFYRYGLGVDLYSEARPLFHEVQQRIQSTDNARLLASYFDFVTALVLAACRPHEVEPVHGIDKSMLQEVLETTLHLTQSKADLEDEETVLATLRFLGAAAKVNNQLYGPSIATSFHSIFKIRIDAKSGFAKNMGELSKLDFKPAKRCCGIDMGHDDLNTIIKLSTNLHILAGLLECLCLGHKEISLENIQVCSLSRLLKKLVEHCQSIFDESKDESARAFRLLPLSDIATLYIRLMRLDIVPVEASQLHKCIGLCPAAHKVEWLLDMVDSDQVIARKERHFIATIYKAIFAIHQTQKLSSWSETCVAPEYKVPIGIDWVFAPLDSILAKDDLLAKGLATLPIDAAIQGHVIDEAQIVAANLKFIRVLHLHNILDPAMVLFACMKVFMLEHEQLESSDEVYTNKEVADQIAEILTQFKVGNVPWTMTGSSTLGAVGRRTLPEGVPVLQFYSDFLALFAGISFGHRSFAQLVILPLRMAEACPEYRRLFWSTYADNLPSVQLTCEDGLVLSAKEGLGAYTEDGEEDMPTLSAMVRALTQPRITKAEQPLLYYIAINQVGRALAETALSLKRQRAIKDAIGSSTQAATLLDDLAGLQKAIH